MISTHTFDGKKTSFVIKLDYVGIEIEVENDLKIYKTDGRLNIFGKKELIQTISINKEKNENKVQSKQ